MEPCALKNENNCLNTNIYSFLETTGGQSSNLYLNVVHFFSTPVLIRHLWQLKADVFMHWHLTCSVLLKTKMKDNLKLSVKTQELFHLHCSAQCLKTFSFRNLRILEVSESVCRQQAFPAQSNVLRIRQGAHPKSQHLKRTDILAYFEHSKSNGRKMFYNFGPWFDILKTT